MQSCNLQSCHAAQLNEILKSHSGEACRGSKLGGVVDQQLWKGNGEVALDIHHLQLLSRKKSAQQMYSISKLEISHPRLCIKKQEQTFLNAIIAIVGI